MIHLVTYQLSVSVGTKTETMCRMMLEHLSVLGVSRNGERVRLRKQLDGAFSNSWINFNNSGRRNWNSGTLAIPEEC